MSLCFPFLYFYLISAPLYLKKYGLSSGFLLHVGGEALQELGVLPLSHRSQDRGWSPTPGVHCTGDKMAVTER